MITHQTITRRDRGRIIRQLAATGRWEGWRRPCRIAIYRCLPPGHQVGWAVTQQSHCCPGRALTVWDAVEQINQILDAGKVAPA
jgi:hypothetical protein